jgi:hypothetical protein
MVLLHVDVLRKSKPDGSRSVGLPCAIVPGVELETQKELDATLAARRELGPEHDEQLVAGFLDRIEKEIDRRVNQRLAERGPARKRASALHPANLALCIPLVAIAGGIGGVAGLIVAFIALATVFLVSELRR